MIKMEDSHHGVHYSIKPIDTGKYDVELSQYDNIIYRNTLEISNMEEAIDVVKTKIDDLVS